jgi:hypothetical protein
MNLGEIIRNFSEEATANEALLALGDLSLLARVGRSAGHYEETAGEYAAGAVRRFANLALSEDWLALMNAIERTDEPGLQCLTHMLQWSLRQDEAENAPKHEGCSCGGGGCA